MLGTVERLGRYELLRRIAVGGMAEIFVARECGLAGFERPAIVKRILPSFAEDEKFVNLFVDEARVAAVLAHPNIAHIYELGFERGSYFIAMELVRGCDLQSLLNAVPGPMPLPLDEAVFVVSEVLEGLQYAHALRGPEGRPLGIVHRDVAPKNVLVSLDGAVKLVDFGIAKARIKMSITAPGLVMGTYGYMSPEQASARPVDHRTDVFAAGAVLYRITTGADVYRGSELIDIMDAAVEGDFLPPRAVCPSLPEAVEAVILRAMALDPDDRYPSAAHMRRDLATVARDLGLEGDADTLAALVRRRMPHLEGLVRSWTATDLSSARPPLAIPRTLPQPQISWDEIVSGIDAGRRDPTVPFDAADEETTRDLAESRREPPAPGRVERDAEGEEPRDTLPMDPPDLPMGAPERSGSRPHLPAAEETETDLAAGDIRDTWRDDYDPPALPADLARLLDKVDPAADEEQTTPDLDDEERHRRG